MSDQKNDNFFAKRVGRIKPSPTLALNAKAGYLKSLGRKIINLGVGEPDFDTPDWIKQKAIEGMEKGFTKYTPVDGLSDLKKVISGKFSKENNLSYDPDEIMISTGGKQVIFNAMLATVEADDEVIIPVPYWVSYPDIVNFCGGTPVFLQTSFENNLKITADDLEKAITKKTKWLILNSPSNPTGCVYTKKELEEIAKVLLKHDHVQILSDDIYEYLVFDSAKFFNIIDAEPRLKSRTLIVNGVSKSYSMTGWRIGYGAGHKDLIKAMTMLQSQSTSNPCSIAQFATIGAIGGDIKFLDQWKKSFIERRNLALDYLEKISDLRVIKPEGAFYIYVNCDALVGKKILDQKLIKSDDDFCEYLLDSYNIAVVSGKAFGMSNYFRLSYAVEKSQLESACLEIKKAVEDLV